MNFTSLQTENRQKGMALILAIGFLLVLSILGAVVLQVSSRSLKSSGATAPTQRALYAADRTVEYAMNRDIVINLAVSGIVNLADESTEVRQANGTNVAGVYHKTLINASGPGSIISGTVADKGPRTLPPHMAAIHGSEFGANLYHVNVKTSSNNTSTTGPYTTHVDASIVRLFKMDDDQIFRTSGGG